MLHLLWLQCWGRETRPQQNASVPKTWTVGWGRETPGQQNASGTGATFRPLNKVPKAGAPKRGVNKMPLMLAWTFRSLKKMTPEGNGIHLSTTRLL